jgi:hypothetical protein
MFQNSRPLDWNAWMWWVSLTTLGTMTAMMLAVFVIFAAGGPIQGFFEDEQAASVALQVVMAPLFALAGSLVGLAQWLVLRGQIQRAGWWILATAAGWMAGYLWSYLLFPPGSGTATISEALLPWFLNGLLTGLCQWLVLRKFFDRSSLWVPTAALAMTIGTSGWILFGIYGGVFLWLIGGAFSGWILLSVLSPKGPWPEVDDR